jgi:hypothetical protein
MIPARNWDYRAERLAGYAFFGRRVLKVLIILSIAWFMLRLVPPNLWHPPKSHIGHLEKHIMRSLALGWSSYHAEYGLPNAKEDVTTLSDADFMRPLLALDEISNPRRLKFVDFATAKGRRPGLIKDTHALVDSWGQPYHIILDTNNDGRVANPEATANPDSKLRIKAPDVLNIQAAIYSSGPDRDPETWQDNIPNWR